MDTKVSEILRMLDNYEGNEKEIFEQIQAKQWLNINNVKK